jgi:hypothetical protein
VKPAPAQGLGLLVEPIGSEDPLDAKAGEYHARPLELDATGHVSISFFTDGRALDFGLRLVPVTTSGVRGRPVDLRIQEPALPGLHQFLFRNGWMIRTAVLVVFGVGIVFYGVRRIRRRRAAVEQADEADDPAAGTLV